MPYKLSATLTGHSQDVRGVASPTTGVVLSASRDATALVWSKSEEGSSFTILATYKPSETFINAITFAPATSEAPQGYVVTGGQDGIINVFILGSPSTEPSYSLLGHTSNVCALAASPTGTIISGSWDSTARVWKDFKELYILKGHTQSVWAVLPVDETRTLTASADRTIKLWEQNQEINRFHGHNDAVRGLALVQDIGFASCSNDSEIRVWTFQAILPSGDLVSSGEDRTVRVWKDGECSQTIVHPAISVWTVSTMPNGDIVSGCSDGAVRIFSESEERWASADELKLYEDTIANQALPSQQMSNVQKSNLPGPEALSNPGKKEGQVIMIKNGDVVEAHQWDSSSKSWQKIGEVVDTVGSNRKQLFEGREYDYVFDVDIKEGAPPLKLPYNANENPYQAAHRFLVRNELPLTFIDEVANFINKNTKPVHLGPTNEEYRDPFTGASRYIPGGTQAPLPSSTPSQPTAPSSSVNSANVDPFTGASRGSVNAKILPVLSSVPFKQANVPAMEKKIQELNEACSDASLALQPTETASLTELFGALNTNNTGQITSQHISILVAVIQRWPNDQVFPVIDLLRLVLASSPSAFRSVKDKPAVVAALLNKIGLDEPWDQPLSKSRETNILLVLRAIANMLQTQSGSVPAPWTTTAFTALKSIPSNAWNKAQLLALSTLLLNYSVVVHRSTNAAQDQELHLGLIESVLGNSNADNETLYRSLVAFGNVVSSNAKPKLGKATAGWLRVSSAAGKRAGEKRISDLINETQSLIL